MISWLVRDMFNRNPHTMITNVIVAWNKYKVFCIDQDKWGDYMLQALSINAMFFE